MSRTREKADLKTVILSPGGVAPSTMDGALTRGARPLQVAVTPSPRSGGHIALRFYEVSEFSQVGRGLASDCGAHEREQ